MQLEMELSQRRIRSRAGSPFLPLRTICAVSVHTRSTNWVWAGSSQLILRQEGNLKAWPWHSAGWFIGDSSRHSDDEVCRQCNCIETALTRDW